MFIIKLMILSFLLLTWLAAILTLIVYIILGLKG